MPDDTLRPLRAEPIRSNECVLEPLATSHAEEMAVVLGSPALHRFTGGAPETPERLRVRFERLTAGSPDPDVDWLNWVIRLQATGELAGTVQATVSYSGRESVATVAWIVGVRWQGRGIGTEAACTMVSWLQASNVDVIEAHVHPEHIASSSIARTAGLLATEDRRGGEVVWRTVRDSTCPDETD